MLSLEFEIWTGCETLTCIKGFTERFAVWAVHLHIGTASCSHTPACPMPPHNSPSPPAPGPFCSALGSVNTPPSRWSPAPRHTRVWPWRSHLSSPKLPAAVGCWPRVGSDPRHNRSHGGTRHCCTEDLKEIFKEIFFFSKETFNWSKVTNDVTKYFLTILQKLKIFLSRFPQKNIKQLKTN